MTAPRALLADIVDYAGLFPPAALDMRTALSNFVSYQSGPDAWMLGRFVVPASRLDEVRDASVAMGAPPVRLSVLLGVDTLVDVDRVHLFSKDSGHRFAVDCLEGKFTSGAAIRAATKAAGELRLFAEVPVADDPQILIDAIADCGASAKIRTGGTTPEAFPPAADIIRFIRRCIEAGVAFKATAGLHHPLCAEYRLTYEDGAACSSMFGFLNVFLAAAAIASGASDEDASRILTERRSAAFRWATDAVSWAGITMSADELERVRAHVAVSFGSCSFREPVDESRALGLIE